MQNIKAFLVVTMIVVLFAGYSSEISMAAEVTRIHKNKGHIYVNEGKDAGFVKGATVCFLSSSGEELLCGRVLKVADNYTVVKVDNRKIKKIKIGTEAKLQVEKDGKE